MEKTQKRPKGQCRLVERAPGGAVLEHIVVEGADFREDSLATQVGGPKLQPEPALDRLQQGKTPTEIVFSELQRCLDQGPYLAGVLKHQKVRGLDPGFFQFRHGVINSSSFQVDGRVLPEVDELQARAYEV